MNNKIKEHVKAYNEKDNYPTTDKDIIETIREAERVYEKPIGESRWWWNVFVVVLVDGMLIGFKDAHTTGDTSPEDIGFEFDPSTICEVEEYEETVTIKKYRKKKEMK